MSKNLFQDMVKINNTRRQPRPEARNIREPEDVDEKEFENKSARAGGEGPKTRSTLWLVAMVAVLFFLFSLSYLFSRAEIIIDPKIENIALDKSFSASLNGDANQLSFDLVVISGEESKIIAATEEKEVSEHARGTVILYNAFSSASQRLDIDTRLEGTNGKIYKTEKALIVPGMKGTT